MVILFFVQSSYSYEYMPWSQVKKDTEKQLLKENRAEAVKILKNYIDRKPLKKDLQQAIELLNNALNLFLTEEAHKTYFLGKSLFFNEPERAKEKFLLAKTKEPLNEKISLDLTRLYLFTGDCKSANKEAKEAYELNPYNKSLKIVLLQTYFCLSDWETFSLIFNELKKEKELTPFEEAFVEVLNLKGELSTEEAKSHIDKLMAKDSGFPLSLYWKQLSLKESQPKETQFAEKYLSVCQNNKPKVVEKYENFPSLCNYVSEMESALQ